VQGVTVPKHTYMHSRMQHDDVIQAPSCAGCHQMFTVPKHTHMQHDEVIQAAGCHQMFTVPKHTRMQRDEVIHAPSCAGCYKTVTVPKCTAPFPPCWGMGDAFYCRAGRLANQCRTADTAKNPAGTFSLDECTSPCMNTTLPGISFTVSQTCQPHMHTHAHTITHSLFPSLSLTHTHTNTSGDTTSKCSTDV
jgi:hypothetical protein